MIGIEVIWGGFSIAHGMYDRMPAGINVRFVVMFWIEDDILQRAHEMFDGMSMNGYRGVYCLGSFFKFIRRVLCGFCERIGCELCGLLLELDAIEH